MNERTIVALVGHDGSGRDFHMAHTDKVMIMVVTDNIAKESRLHANERCFYFGAGEHFAAHMMVRSPSGEYVRGNVHHNAAYQTKYVTPTNQTATAMSAFNPESGYS